jgi:hypothetical protein
MKPPQQTLPHVQTLPTAPLPTTAKRAWESTPSEFLPSGDPPGGSAVLWEELGGPTFWKGEARRRERCQWDACIVDSWGVAAIRLERSRCWGYLREAGGPGAGGARSCRPKSIGDAGLGEVGLIDTSHKSRVAQALQLILVLAGF